MKNNLKLSDLIQEIKAELIESSEQSKAANKNNDTPYLFKLDEVELEIKFCVDTTAKAGLRIFVYSGEGTLSSMKEQTARIKFKVIGKNITDNSNNDSKDDTRYCLPVEPQTITSPQIGVQHVVPPPKHE